jgi:hypothetical protein
MRRKPPHILVTTPESLYILLTSESGRKTLASTRTVIVDEIHALAPNKRGAHLALSLERLEHITGNRLTRVGLSATQKPIDEVARFLVGLGGRPAKDLFEEGSDAGAAHSPACAIVDTGHVRRRDLAIEVPEGPLEAVMSGEVWGQVYERLTSLIQEHRSTIVFVNTRRLAERLARALTERLGEEQVTSHHGSLAREQRLNAEQKLKRGELKALVATSSLELGIDIGHVDLVCQISSPRRLHRSGARTSRTHCALCTSALGRRGQLHTDSPDERTLQITGAGPCTVTAAQGGNANYNSAPPAQQSFNIAKAINDPVVKQKLIAVADRVIDTYRTTDTPVGEKDWERARTNAARALAVDPDDVARGKLRIAEGHLARINGTVHRAPAGDPCIGRRGNGRSDRTARRRRGRSRAPR